MQGRAGKELMGCSRISRSIGNQKIWKRKKEKAKELKTPMTKKKEIKGHLREDRIMGAVSGEEKGILCHC